MPKADVKISIIIPVKNAEYWLHETLDGIFSQTLIETCEVILIDSGSTDKTLAIAKEYDVRLISIPSEEFNHGETRNFGVRIARGQYVVMTVQDAKPANEFWLQYLLDGFTEANVAGVCGSQIVPHEADKNPVDWFRPISEPTPRWVYIPRAQFDELTPSGQHSLCTWDDVNSMYRREILLKLPFQKVTFAEDALWARDALRAGYTLAYNPKSQVNHYHEETSQYTFKRSFTIFYHFYIYFQVMPLPLPGELLSILRNLKVLLKEQNIAWKDKARWMIYNSQQRRAYRKAMSVFNKVVTQGSDKLEMKHQEICKFSPQANVPHRKN